ncbi:MAG: TlpA disulfide reductase family protein [Chloroflexi bacterium]|nr:TlpA disulfide reductase family protein [Chloroflexota bacterium]
MDDFVKRRAFINLLFVINMILAILTGCAAGIPASVENVTPIPDSQNGELTENIVLSDNVTVPSYAPACAAGRAAPVFTLNSLNGDSVSLRTLRGKNILLNFWAIWCEPCMRELPYLEQYNRQRKQDNLLIISICSESDVNSINDYVLRTGLTFPILLDRDGKIRRLYSYEKKKLLVLPTTFFIDSQGIIAKISRHTFTGVDDIEKTVTELKFGQ